MNGERSNAKRTGARPMVVEGVTFHCYHVGIQRYEWRSEDGRLRVGRNFESPSFYAIINGRTVLGPDGRRAKRFHLLSTAMAAAVKLGMASA
ncbi:MAG: hypothetical protein J2P55_00165 [Rhizobiales bacterium]|nr:hypothetical protein [Hyphomicrobiales bacterium]